MILDSPETFVDKNNGEGVFVNSRGMHELEQVDGIKSMNHCVCWHPRLVGGNPDSVFWQDYVHPLVSSLPQSTPSSKKLLDASRIKLILINKEILELTSS